jgi:hypothetical protein
MIYLKIHAERRGEYKVCGEKQEVKKSLGRPRHVGKNDIRMDLEGECWEGVGWIDLARGSGNLWNQ